jgi:hypothetical protein
MAVNCSWKIQAIVQQSYLMMAFLAQYEGLLLGW